MRLISLDRVTYGPGSGIFPVSSCIRLSRRYTLYIHFQNLWHHLISVSSAYRNTSAHSSFLYPATPAAHTNSAPTRWTHRSRQRSGVKGRPQRPWSCIDYDMCRWRSLWRRHSGAGRGCTWSRRHRPQVWQLGLLSCFTSNEEEEKNQIQRYFVMFSF